MAKELEVIKEEQIRSREEAAAFRKAAAAKHRKMLEVANKNNSKIKESFDSLQDKLKKDLEGRLSAEWLKKMIKLLHRTETHIKCAALTAHGQIPDKTGDDPQTGPVAGQEQPLVPKSHELPNANRATESWGDGDVGKYATIPSGSNSSSSSSSSDSESDGGMGREGRKKNSGKDTGRKKDTGRMKEDEQVDRAFWLRDLHTHRREKKKSRKLQMNQPQTLDGDWSSKLTYRQSCSGLERYLDYHCGEWEKEADLLGSYMKDKALAWFDTRALHLKAVKVNDTFKAFVEAMDTRLKNDNEA